MGDGGEDGIALRQLLSFSVLSMKQRGIFFFFMFPFGLTEKKVKHSILQSRCEKTLSARDCPRDDVSCWASGKMEGEAFTTGEG